MVRLNDETRAKIKVLVKEGNSLNKISNLMKVNKTTVYYWYRKIKKPKRKIAVNRNLSDELLGEFIGIFAGDGSYVMDRLYHHQITIHINKNDKKYASHIRKLMKLIFSKNPYNYVSEKEGVVRIRIRSKDGYILLRRYLDWEHTKTQTVRLRYVSEVSLRFLIGFLRGLMDTDGHIDKNLNYATFATISERLAENIRYGLDKFQIKYSTYVYKSVNKSPITHIRISKVGMNKFIKIIEPVHLGK